MRTATHGEGLATGGGSDGVDAIVQADGQLPLAGRWLQNRHPAEKKEDEEGQQGPASLWAGLTAPGTEGAADRWHGWHARTRPDPGKGIAGHPEASTADKASEQSWHGPWERACEQEARVQALASTEPPAPSTEELRERPLEAHGPAKLRSYGSSGTSLQQQKWVFPNLFLFIIAAQ